MSYNIGTKEVRNTSQSSKDPQNTINPSCLAQYSLTIRPFLEKISIFYNIFFVISLLLFVYL